MSILKPVRFIDGSGAHDYYLVSEVDEALRDAERKGYVRGLRRAAWLEALGGVPADIQGDLRAEADEAEGAVRCDGGLDQDEADERHE